MGNICQPLSSDTVFDTPSTVLASGNNIIDLVDPQGFGNCANALEDFETRDCVVSTAVLVCLLEDEEKVPEKIDLCPSTDIWLADFRGFDFNFGLTVNFLDIPDGVKEIKCQNEECSFNKIRGNVDFDPCPFFTTPFAEEDFKIKDSFFFEFGFNTLDNILDGDFDPFDPVDVQVNAINFEDDTNPDSSVFVCQEAVLSNQGLVEEAKAEKGKLEIDDGAAKKAKTNNKKRVLLEEEEPKQRQRRMVRGGGASNNNNTLLPPTADALVEDGDAGTSRSRHLQVSTDGETIIRTAWSCVLDKTGKTSELVAADIVAHPECLVLPAAQASNVIGI
ncbi:MAG: hypothetical protein SGILL_007700 [Bacillariaceae sp.]